MKNRKILVFGRVGQVGWELRHKLACLGEVVSVDYPEIDFSKPETIRAAVRAAAPTVIVNAAAYTAVDKAESAPEPAWALNAAGPGVIAEEAKRLGALMVHYSTDYVYDGSKLGAWVETDVPHPLNVYGQTKLAGDEAIAAVGGDYLILRTSWVYGARGGNFLLTMLRLAKERTELRIVDDQTGSPTTSECIAQATAQILAQVTAPGAGGLGGRSGVYHLTCSGAATWFGFAKAFLSRQAACPTLTPIASSEYPLPAQRPVNSVLNCERVAQTFGVRMPAWEDALELVLETLSEGAPRV
ncbi:MAG: dTDP-4-dehydrorhamnose reductase [Terracidiphilus sp.]|nr:dTDP-4-dehydrorhamnose reductase [Terracidiphilus sp.]